MWSESIVLRKMIRNVSLRIIKREYVFRERLSCSISNEGLDRIPSHIVVWLVEGVVVMLGMGFLLL